MGLTEPPENPWRNPPRQGPAQVKVPITGQS